MPDIHTIRLRHPWTCEVVDGRAVWSRGFNWPAGLVAREVVWLVIEPPPTEATIRVNDQPLVASDLPGRFDITSLIVEFNRVTITLADSTGNVDSCCPWDVRLEIKEA